MVSKLFLALLVTCSTNFASTHIVTSAHSDLSLLSCVSSLSNTVQTTLCPMYGQVEQYSMEYMMHPALDPSVAEARRWEFRNNMKRCCTRPCTISELVAIC